MKKYIAILCMVTGCAFAQNTPTANAPQEVVVRVQAQSAPEANKPVVQKANEWVEFGKNVGAAMDAGLTSLTDHADKFSKTDAGKFTMAVIAWKVAGRDALDVTQYVTDKVVHMVVGSVCLVVWITLAFLFIRREFVQHRIVIKKSGPFWNQTKEYKLINGEFFGEGKSAGYVLSVILTIVGSIGLIAFIAS